MLSDYHILNTAYDCLIRSGVQFGGSRRYSERNRIGWVYDLRFRAYTREDN
jgi:hypothetical protein